MDVLKEIQQTIETLGSSPSSVDLSYVRSILVESYNVVRDGLQRSNYADKYVDINKKFEALSQENATLKADIQTARADVEKLQPQIKPFENLFADLKNKLVGKLQLVKSFTPEYRAVLVEQIGKASPDLFLQLKVQIESMFSKEWVDRVSSAPCVIPGGAFLDLKPFKSGR